MLRNKNMDINPHPKMLIKLHKHRAEIDLAPEYQRGKVWSKDKQQLLIDTIIKKMHIPPIYFRVLENGYYECVDGQQRCTAIFDFLDTSFPLSKKYSGELGGKYFRDLPTNLQDRIEDYELMVFEINNASDEEIREMFDRLQRGMSLTAGEKLKAKTGQLHTFITQLTETPFFKNIINVKDYRGSYYQMCSQITALELNGIKDVKFKNLEELHKGTFDPESTKAQQVKKVINFLSRTSDDRVPELHTRAEVVSLYLLISEIMKEYALKDNEVLIKPFLIDFNRKLRLAEEKNDNVELLTYLNSISHSSDSAASIKKRHDILMAHFLLFAPNLLPLDTNRGFSEAQRIAIYRKNDGACQKCGVKVPYGSSYHADHIIPHSRGGKTTVENGQLLCNKCNQSEGAK